MNNTGMPNSTLNWSTPQASAILEIKLHSYFQRLQIPSTLQTRTDNVGTRTDNVGTPRYSAENNHSCEPT